jgi:hypothetical protein
VFGVMRAYEYRFTPYILMTRPDVSATDAIRVSKEETMGRKTQMFWADMLVAIVFWAACFILWLLARLPFVGVLFWVLLFALEIFAVLFATLFYGVLHAAFYVEIKTAPAAPEDAPAEDETPEATETPAEDETPEAPAEGEAPETPETPAAPVEGEPL